MDIQACSQNILLGVVFEGNVDILFQPTSPGAVRAYMVHAYSPHSRGLVNIHTMFLQSALYLHVL